MWLRRVQFLRAGAARFLVFGDCYRRDEIDASHYPVFHQAEGVRVWRRSADDVRHGRLSVEWLVADLQRTLDGLVSHLFGVQAPRRWLDDSFPFTRPSLQVEVQFQGRWMEVLGCGVIRPEICRVFPGDGDGEGGEAVGWAFGLGLERLAMVLFDIPDIRLFWSEDERFLSQFTPAAASHSAAFHAIKFRPFSRYPPCPKDLSFWLPDDGAARGEHPPQPQPQPQPQPPRQAQPQSEPQHDGPSGAFHENDLFAVIRAVAGDVVESVRLQGEEFVHPISGRRSRCYRVLYRSMTHSLTHDEANALHQQVREAVHSALRLELR